MADKHNADFTAETLEWLEKASLKSRQSMGQYMTPRFLRTFLLSKLDIQSGDRVLDPAVGTGEFLKQANETFSDIHLTGWDIDNQILEVARKNISVAELLQRNALEKYDGELFDYVIGNPPYFQLKLEGQLKEQFKDVISGRPNIFALFFKVGLDALRPGGTLAFVVPPSMNSGAYFKNLRKFLTSQNHVVSLKVFDDSSHFVDAQTSVQVIVIKKGPGKSRNTFEVEGKDTSHSSLIFCEDPSEFKKLYINSYSLTSLGYEAITGNTVWNQFKDELTNSPGVDTLPLLYARNIVDGKIRLSPDDRRPQYIRNGRHLVGPAIVVNRIIGGVGKGQIKAAIVPKGFKFAAENHLNVIRARTAAETKIDLDSLLTLMTSEDIVLKARTLTGNTQLSATEWNHLIPFGVDHLSIQT